MKKSIVIAANADGYTLFFNSVSHAATPALYPNATFDTLPFIKDKRLSALAISTAARSPALPDVSTIAEAGLPG